MIRETFKMWHPDHGEAQCSEEQWAEFEGLGWKRKRAEPVADAGATAAPRGRKVK